MSTHAVSKLDDLIVTTIDSINGYEQAADHADAARYAEAFRSMAAERRAVVAELQAESRRLGGTPNDFGSVAAHIHRRWEDIRHAFGGGDQAVAAEVERGEAYLRQEFDRVLADDRMPAETLAVVGRVYGSVTRGIEDAGRRKQVLAA